MSWLLENPDILGPLAATVSGITAACSSATKPYRLLRYGPVGLFDADIVATYRLGKAVLGNKPHKKLPPQVLTLCTPLPQEKQLQKQYFSQIYTNDTVVRYLLGSKHL